MTPEKAKEDLQNLTAWLNDVTQRIPAVNTQIAYLQGWLARDAEIQQPVEDQDQGVE